MSDNDCCAGLITVLREIRQYALDERDPALLPVVEMVDDALDDDRDDEQAYVESLRADAPWGTSNAGLKAWED